MTIPDHAEPRDESLDDLVRSEMAAVALVDGALTLSVCVNDPFTGEIVEYPPFSLAPLGEWEVMITEGDWEGNRAQFIPEADGQPRFMRLGGRLAKRQSTTEHS